MSIFFRRYPSRTSVPSQNTKFVTVARFSTGIYIIDACDGTANGPGCRQFLSEFGLTYCQSSHPPRPITKRQELSHPNVLDSRQDDSDEQPSLDLQDTVFECFPGLALPSDGAFPTTINAAMSTSFFLETDTATAIPTIAPSDIESMAAPASGTVFTYDDSAATTLVPAVSSSATPTAAPNANIAPDSGKPGGNAPAGSSENPADGSGTNTNPEDPYANSGPGIVNPP